MPVIQEFSLFIYFSPKPSTLLFNLQITSDQEHWDNNVFTLHCSYNSYIVITSVRYYHPKWTLACEDEPNAYSKTANHCNNRLDCSIDTTPGNFYGDPCWLHSKKLEVKTSLKLYNIIIE